MTTQNLPAKESGALRGTALVVDDDATNLLYLQLQLERENYRVVTATDGIEAVAVFERERPDIVFMDVMLPGRNGYEAGRMIKALVGDAFVPMIYLTALSEDEALARCIEAGGDDFLAKPYKRPILKAKIDAIERIRSLHARVCHQHAELSTLHGRMQREQEIAEQVFSNAVMADNSALARIQSWLKPAQTFSGDLVIAAHTPSGGIAVLLGDFTGHGLSAAIGVLPAAETFRAMIGKGFGLSETLAEINRKLYRLLPTGMFMACAALRIEPELMTAQVWNSGLPDVLVRGPEGSPIRHRIASLHPPLGALPGFLGGCLPQLIDISQGDLVAMCSDGVLEARNAEGQMFGESRYRDLVLQAQAVGAFERVTHKLQDFIGQTPQDDDMTVACVMCTPELFASALSLAPLPAQASAKHALQADWHWRISLQGRNLHDIDPVPLAMSQLAALKIPELQRKDLYVVLTELFSNALEHGVLGLDSALKNTAEGFMQYYNLRQNALRQLQSGEISFDFHYSQEAQGPRLRIVVQDSGQGFAWQAHGAGMAPERLASGRGLGLVRSLCESVQFSGIGNRVEVCFLPYG